jgi:hypothetical protein
LFFLSINVCIIISAAIATKLVCKIYLFSTPPQSSSSSSTTTWRRRERSVQKEELAAATCLCAPAIPFYPSTVQLHFFFAERTL